MKKLFNRKVFLGTIIFLILAFILLFVLIKYALYKESIEHDSLPVILSKNVTMQRVNDELFNASEYQDGEKCSDGENQMTFQASKGQFYIEPQRDHFTCKKFITTKGILYDIYPGGTATGALFLKTTGGVELVIKQYGEYPGNNYYAKGGPNDVILRYSGWNNPRKVLKLTIN